VSPSTAPTAVMPVGLTGINVPATPAVELCGLLSLLDVPLAARAAVERLSLGHPRAVFCNSTAPETVRVGGPTSRWLFYGCTISASSHRAALEHGPVKTRCYACSVHLVGADVPSCPLVTPSPF